MESSTGQKKKHSLLEVFLNILIGFGIAQTAQIVIFPLFGIHIPLHDNLMIGVIFTFISVIRGYAIRRLFNYLHLKGVL